MNRSREIIEIFADVVKATSNDCEIVVMRQGALQTMACPPINYTFGNSQYVKDRLDELSQSARGNEIKFPLIVLFCPFVERRDNPDCFSEATVNVLIAVSSRSEWSNEQRLETSFRKVLRPIYRSLMAALKADGRLDFGYDEVIPHKYSENYSYGRYGAHTGTGDAVSEPIDAINISELQLKVTNKTCR